MSINTNPIVIIGSVTYTENDSSGIVIGTQTLTPGGVITVSGTVLSLPGPTTPVTLVTSTRGLAGQGPVTSVVIAGQTLTAGGRVTVGGDVLSLAPSGTGIVVIGTVTVDVAAATGTSGKKNSGGRSSSLSFGIQLLTVGLMSLFLC
jgi:hypothetical protein